MKNQVIAIASIVCLLVGCAEPCPHYNRIRVVSFPGAPITTQPKKPYGSVKLYQDKSEITKKYEVMALMTLEGDAGDEARFVTAFLCRAADLGADGVILYRGPQQNVAGPWWTSGVHAAYRAEAIRFP